GIETFSVTHRARERHNMNDKEKAAKLADALDERLDELGKQLDKAFDEAERAFFDLTPEQREARREQLSAMFAEYQRRWQELSKKAIRIYDALDALDEGNKEQTA